MLHARPSGRPRAIRRVCPARLIRGHASSYYAVLRDRRKFHRRESRRTARPRLSSSSSRKSSTLGTHRFDRDARAGRGRRAVPRRIEVGWQTPTPGPGPKAGPQSFLVGPDHSIWLHDSFNDRMLVWNAGDPNTIVRSVPLPTGQRRQRRRFRAERVAVRHTRRGPRAQLPHRLEPPQPDGAHHVDGAAGRRLLRRLAIVHDRDEQRPAAWPRRNAARARGHVRTPGRPVRLDARRDARRPRDPAMPAAVRGTDWPYQPIGTGSAWSPRPTRPVIDGPVQEVRVAIVNRHGNVVRAWRVMSRTPINLHDTPDILRGAPTLVLDASR